MSDAHKVTARLSDDSFDLFQIILERVEKIEGARPAIAVLARQMIDEGIKQWCEKYGIDETTLKRWRAKRAALSSSKRSKK